MDNRILVIDGFDEVEVYSQSLRSAGFVVERSRGDAALSLVQKGPVSAVVAPVIESSERELVARIREVRAELPIIGVGADVELELAMLCISQPVVAGVFVSIVKYVLQQMRIRRAWRDLPCEVVVSATDAKNEFASILETAVARGPVCIQKHGEARAVLIGWDDYEKLTAAPDRLDVLRNEYDALLGRMQQPGMRERMQSAFDATPDELAAAAVSQAHRGR
jgi:antitoxin Phd